MSEVSFHISRNDPADFRAKVICNNEIIGKVNIRRNSDKGFYEDWYDLSATVNDVYLEETLMLCLEQAFEEMGAASVHAVCESFRESIVNAFYHTGFVLESEEHHISRFVITEKQYYRDQSDPRSK